jgi:multidrug efflux pump subunit AcrA (membrane-fusion protein)
LADLSVVDVVAEVPERSLPLVRIGQGASISIAAYPEMRFAGQVERLRDELNPETRTVRAVIHVPNSSSRLRPGMFATVRLRVAAAAVARATGATEAAATLMTILESAVVTDGDRRYVFVEVAERTYERREVQVSSLAPPGSTMPGGDRVAVRSGLVAGDRVVVSGAFILKSELAKAGLGGHGH